MEHIVCSFLVFLCGSMTHLRISLRFFFSHLRGCSLDQLGKNSLRMRSKSHNLKIDSKMSTWICCRCLRYLHISPHIISTRMLGIPASGKICNLHLGSSDFTPKYLQSRDLAILAHCPYGILMCWKDEIGTLDAGFTLISLKPCCDLLIFAYTDTILILTILCLISDWKSNRPIIQFE